MNTMLMAAVLAVGLFVGILAMLEFGRRLGIRRLAIDPAGAQAGTGAVEGAVFALVGLLIAFTFSGAASRFAVRRDLIVAETNAIGTAWVAGITVLICSDILGRVLFNSPIIGVPEIVKVSVVAIVWLQMAHTLKINGHLRSDVILGRLPRRGRSIVDLIAYALGAFIFGLVVYSGWNTMIMAWELGEFEGEEPVRVPTYPIRSIVLLGAGLTSLQFLLMAGKVVVEMTAQHRKEEE